MIQIRAFKEKEKEGGERKPQFGGRSKVPMLGGPLKVPNFVANGRFQAWWPLESSKFCGQWKWPLEGSKFCGQWKSLSLVALERF
jgi:hypothetical protein